MEITPNYQLKKPTYEEFGDIEILNENADRIDTALKVLSDALGGIDLVSLLQAISTVDGRFTQHLDEFDQHLKETASLTEIGHTKLSNAIDSTLDTLASTPSAVKQAYDKGSDAFNDTNELRAEFLAFKTALTEGFSANQFSDGLTTLNGFNVTSGYYNQSLTRLEV